LVQSQDNIEEEVFGKGIKFTRPVLIFKKFTKNSFLGLPLTGQEKIGSWYVTINMPSRKSSAMLNQARVFDRIRLRERITTMKDQDFQTIKEEFRDFYCRDDNNHPASVRGGDQWEIPNSL
jgi:mRNA-degrading endonuclease toxin of MazEF toxin-antitoxin module